MKFRTPREAQVWKNLVKSIEGTTLGDDAQARARVRSIEAAVTLLRTSDAEVLQSLLDKHFKATDSNSSRMLASVHELQAEVLRLNATMKVQDARLVQFTKTETPEQITHDLERKLVAIQTDASSTKETVAEVLDALLELKAGNPIPATKAVQEAATIAPAPSRNGGMFKAVASSAKKVASSLMSNLATGRSKASNVTLSIDKKTGVEQIHEEKAREDRKSFLHLFKDQVSWLKKLVTRKPKDKGDDKGILSSMLSAGAIMASIKGLLEMFKGGIGSMASKGGGGFKAIFKGLGAMGAVAAGAAGRVGVGLLKSLPKLLRLAPRLIPGVGLVALVAIEGAIELYNRYQPQIDAAIKKGWEFAQGVWERLMGEAKAFAEDPEGYSRALAGNVIGEDNIQRAVEAINATRRIARDLFHYATEKARFAYRKAGDVASAIKRQLDWLDDLFGAAQERIMAQTHAVIGEIKSIDAFIGNTQRDYIVPAKDKVVGVLKAGDSWLGDKQEQWFGKGFGNRNVDANGNVPIQQPKVLGAIDNFVGREQKDVVAAKGAINRGGQWLGDKKRGMLSGAQSAVSTAKGIGGALGRGQQNMAAAGSTVASVARSTTDGARGIGSTIASGARNFAGASQRAWGQLFTKKADVNLEGLDPSFSQRLAAAFQEYKNMGGKGTPQINSAVRSPEEQAKLFRKDPTRAAPPGASWHERGLALDMNSDVANEMARMGILQRHGLAQPISSEPWHIQPIEVPARGAAAAQRSPAQALRVPAQPSAQGVPGGDGRTSGSPVRQTAPVHAPMQTSSAGSLSNIPTYQYGDGMFFAMNMQALG